jgi:trehalose 6-phosphate synthase
MPQRIIIVANAGPAKVDQNGNTTLSAGGVVTALSGLGSLMGGFTWIQAPATPIEFQMAKSGRRLPSLGPIQVVLAKLTPQQRQALYTQICNGVLVHCAHYNEALARPMLRKLGSTWDQTWNLFREASQAMVQAALEQVLSTTRGTKHGMFLEDYQMVLTPALARRQLEAHGRSGDVSLQMHIHSPWAGPQHWKVVPSSARTEIAQGMLGADTLGFHTQSDVRNFADCVRQWLPGQTQISGNSITFEGRTITLIVNPIGIDTAEMSERLASTEGARAVDAIRTKIDGRQYVFAGIGRTDPMKNLDVLVRAFKLFLDNNPDKINKSVLLLHLTKSRQDVEVYAQHKALLDQLVAKINADYWQRAGNRNVIEAYYASDPYLHLGLYAQYTVLIVPSERDGFALTAVEGPWLNQQDGVLILSIGAGAFIRLENGVLRFEPGGTLKAKVNQLAHLLQRASEMPREERISRQKHLRTIIRRYNLEAWLKQRLSFIK